MSLIGSAVQAAAQRIRLPDMPGLGGPASPLAAPRPASPPGAAGPAGAAFGEVFSQLVAGHETRQAEAAAVTRSVLLGEGTPLHQSIIAQQEASLSLSLMVEVRNKVIEGYQELMRMPV